MKQKTASAKPISFKAYVYEVVVGGGVLKAHLFLSKMR